jgi:hypothetical protein
MSPHLADASANSSNSRHQYSVLRAFEIDQFEFGERVGLDSLMW